MEKPSLLGRSEALDGVRWLVYGDWLEECGLLEEAVKARGIGRRLREGTHKLWLYYFHAGETFISCACKNSEDFDYGITDELKYEWSDKPSRIRNLKCNPICPLDFPRLFSERMDLVEAYWRVLGELSVGS